MSPLAAMRTNAPLHFPADFRWGAAASAYQVEGAVDADGRGESIWDRFCRRPGRIVNGDTGAVACDSYRRYPQDIGLLQELRADAYRFSIAWPRILPDGRGRINDAGLDYYDRYVDALLAAGIEPFVTLYHWDLPQALEEHGGWPVRDTAYAFAEYVDVVSARLGDRVQNWITQNEPWVVAWLGYGQGDHAPGRTSETDALAAAHHVLLAHGLAAQALRSRWPGAQVGITVDLVAFEPLTASAADLEAVRRADGLRNRFILDPLLRGAYPEDVLADRPLPPEVRAGDLQTIAAPLDFLGVNYYTRNVVRAGPGGAPVDVAPDSSRSTAMGWEVYPRGLFDILTRLRDEYPPLPLYITENGAAFRDRRVGDTVEDPLRIAYIEEHLEALGEAIAAGVPVHGYFLWSLLDNFEWALGYSRRFGIVYVDFETLERVPKASFRWYRDFIAAQRAELRPAAVA